MLLRLRAASVMWLKVPVDDGEPVGHERHHPAGKLRMQIHRVRVGIARYRDDRHQSPSVRFMYEQLIPSVAPS
jgi:hypothetical protein